MTTGDIHASQVARVIKNLPANAEGVRDMGSISRSERSHGEGNGNPLQYSVLENSTDRGPWQANSPWGHKELDMTERQSTDNGHITLY